MKILVTGGTVFVSRCTAQYFAERGHKVFVLNRGSRPQALGVTLLRQDRRRLNGALKRLCFDAVLDITAYTRDDIACLLDEIGGFGVYLMVSSSAVYPETLPQPFREEDPCGENIHWGAYGTDKLAAERCLLERVPEAYVLRPPYLYGAGNNLYREAFVFECAQAGRPFYLPQDGSMPLQMFHIRDLCRFMELLLERRPSRHIFNVGNPGIVTVRDWVTLCYQAAGREPEFVHVDSNVPQRSYFPFRNYGYRLDVARQTQLMPETMPLAEGLTDAYAWWREHPDEVVRQPFTAYIAAHLS